MGRRNLKGNELEEEEARSSPRIKNRISKIKTKFSHEIHYKVSDESEFLSQFWDSSSLAKWTLTSLLY